MVDRFRAHLEARMSDDDDNNIAEGMMDTDAIIVTNATTEQERERRVACPQRQERPAHI